MELDGNSAALSAHEALQDERQRAYDRLLPQATEILMSRLLGEEYPVKGQLWVYDTVDHMLNDPENYGLLDADFIANAITGHLASFTCIEPHAKRAAQEIIDSERGQRELEDIVTELEEDSKEETV